jgi:hypothetical protein
MIVTQHAAQRWCERVNPRLTPDQAAVVISQHSPAVTKAAAFGCKVVRLANRFKLILDADRVVTVIATDVPWAGHRGRGL